LKDDVDIPQSLKDQADVQMKKLLETDAPTTEEHMAEMAKVGFFAC